MGKRSIRIQEEASPLMEIIGDLIEKFVGNVRRGKLGPRDGKSFSMTAASGSVQLMHEIITEFKNHLEKKGTTGTHSHSCEIITSRDVHRLIWLISFTGDAMLRAQFGTLLLTNVTRRVLSFIRTAAVECKVSSNEVDSFEKGDAGGLDNEKSASLDMQRLATTNRQSSGVCSVAGGTGRGTGTTNDSNESYEEEEQEISTVGIPGRQTLRRAPSRREVDSVVREEAAVLVHSHDFFNCVLQHIVELRAEIEGMCDALCERAVKQLHPTDTVITTGSSHTTRRYLLHALSAGTSFKVIILEGAPLLCEASHKLAAELRSKHAEVQVLPDSSAFAVMGTCTKVLIGAENVLANGGILAPIGTHPLCIAAKHFAVPVLVVTATIKMTPFYPSDAYCTSLVKISRSSAQEIPWNTYGSPGDVLPAPYGADVDTFGSFVVHSPVTEYVPPELITLYATNESEYTPSQIHRIVRENYSPED
ncbi:eIF-2B GDP-GTP exchange factor, putative [Trypanosoma brucei gambiense DAL972]|uniref:Translation initiation factor eIF2B subunit beta n=2 Tax=Trypanosoma brucei TaxID=5691 RepID=C9ZVN5_TRYB9|nr:eIF-2B GDP-GTP exchange factor, putative [Trypanosoma brucei gambiense DAL972]RHW70919.1 translation initiation factor eIF-2B subunit beta [Trypanosoma brucei equiperdum]CBH13473.1 eIF-2B GDP-GTP exchange factor, putative [Trypanosoma brucei gambiense DAL972]|eukprot:XP_011775750.1 eIF-2B GDP-GTP exchange factor, putative [Trypanosoma brucei gambiense DAL972]